MKKRRHALGASLLFLAGCTAGCATERGETLRQPPFRPDRSGYAAFRAERSEVLEPNYLPFMLHRIPSDDPRGDAMVFCRWSQQDMPLRVYIAPPEIPDTLQDEFAPVEPGAYLAAVAAALGMWEKDLEGAVAFERVEAPDDATLSLVLVAREAPQPHPEVKVLGTTSVGQACVANGSVSGPVLDVRYSVSEVNLYIADEYGLLGSDQVQWVALHEIGHVLGMRGHSPIPADLMYEVVRDRVLVSGLSTEDIHSFVSLYRLENGTVFAYLPRDGETEPAVTPPPEGPPSLSMAPFVDARHGFEIHPPKGWLRLETPRGMVTADGVSWDYSASFQVIVERYDTIEDYLDRFGGYYLSRGRLTDWEFTERNGLRTLQATAISHDESSVEQIYFIEVGDGRVIVLVMDCALDDAPSYFPWFEATLASLEIWMAPRSPAGAPAS